MAFQCVVVTPEQQVLDEQVTQAIVPAHDGQVGILTGRAPLLLGLGAGPLHLDMAGGSRRTYFIGGGVAQMKDNKLTILTQEAALPDELDAAASRAELTEANAMKITDEKSYKDRQQAIQRAQARERMALARSGG